MAHLYQICDELRENQSLLEVECHGHFEELRHQIYIRREEAKARIDDIYRCIFLPQCFIVQFVYVYVNTIYICMTRITIHRNRLQFWIATQNVKVEIWVFSIRKVYNFSCPYFQTNFISVLWRMEKGELEFNIFLKTRKNYFIRYILSLKTQ